MKIDVKKDLSEKFIPFEIIIKFETEQDVVNATNSLLIDLPGEDYGFVDDLYKLIKKNQ